MAAVDPQAEAVTRLEAEGWRRLGVGPLVGSSRYVALEKGSTRGVVYHDGTFAKGFARVVLDES